MKILIVLTSHSKLGSTGEKTGFWIEDFFVSVRSSAGNLAGMNIKYMIS
jgi:hypothetical protein